MASHRLLLAGAITAAVLNAQPGSAETVPAVGQLKSFKDWVIGCDNTRRCTALGLTPENGSDGYIAIKRDGVAESAPTLTLVVLMQSRFRRPTLSVQLDGKAPDGKSSWRARIAQPYARVVVTGADAMKLIDAFRQAKTLTLRLSERGRKAIDSAPVSLAGSAAALLYMDDQQQRVDTTTALVKKGPEAAQAVPQPPASPVHDALPMVEIANPPPPPAGIPAADDENCQAYDPLALKVNAISTVWGICSNAAAYNFDYRFWIDGAAGPQELAFSMPGSRESATSVLTNPGLSESGRVLSAFYKGRGLGDCGTISDWVWDGIGFKLLSYSAMDTCSGVAPDDWPVLFTAKMK
ncbi:DUF1176 domain-containing protein [Rhodoligotrophos defluvii]|uniref:DUF1176 domain-containing protein n=1 Tax=Rhodoligotrophos defluvii TaxID=2561934 RepID=UPI001484E991|nr:DUF1176 domain-containing protein [Rhodoligotrophos defluvii]